MANSDYFQSQQSKKQKSDHLKAQLIGLCEGLAADRKVGPKETEILCTWIAKYQHEIKNSLIDQWCGKVQAVLAEDLSDEQRSQKLLLEFDHLIGGEMKMGEGPKSTTTPLDNPPPAVIFKDQAFCLTGDFVFGERHSCAAAIIERGGRVVQSPSRKTDYLVIGTQANPQWVQTSFGRKVEKAAELRDQHGRIKIISEAHWRDALD